MVYKSRISAGNLCCTVSQERFLAWKMRISTMLIVPTLFLGVEYCATFQAALYIETHSLMHQSEFHAASVALSRAADKGKSLINIHKNGYTATLRAFSFSNGWNESEQVSMKCLLTATLPITRSWSSDE